MKIYKKYKVEINVFTPLFISSGEEYSPVELYLDLTAGKLFKIDFNKLAEDLVKKGRRLEDIRLQENTKIVLDDKKIKLELGKDIKNYLSKTEFWEIDKEGIKKQREDPITLKIFIKDGEGEPFIPGSTLKGAFHNLLVFYKGENFYNVKKDIKNFGKLFGFSDFYFEEKKVKVIEVKRGGAIPQFIEGIISGKAEGELRFYETSGDYSDHLDFSLEDLKKWNKELLDKVKNYGSKKTKENLSKVEKIISEKNYENDVILPIGFGKGYDFVVASEKYKEEFLSEGLKRSKLPWPLSKNNQLKRLKIKERNLNIKDLVKKAELIFPSTAWEYNNIPLGWVGMRFSSL